MLVLDNSSANVGAVGFGSDSYGTLMVNGGTLQYANLANGTGPWQTSIGIQSGATLQMNVAASATNAFGGWNSTYTGGGTLSVIGSGMLDLGSYSGGRSVNFSPGALISVSGGTLQAEWNVGWSGNNASLTVGAGATFNLWGYQSVPVNVDALSGAGTVQDITGTATLTVGVAGGSGAFSGVLGGALALIKAGTGLQSLSDAAYTGETAVSDGTLQFADTAPWTAPP